MLNPDDPSILNRREIAEGKLHELGRAVPVPPTQQTALTYLGQMYAHVLESQPPADAERVLRKALANQGNHHRDSTLIFYIKSLLGAALTAQKALDEAESLLIEGYAGLARSNSDWVREASKRLSELDEVRGKPGASLTAMRVLLEQLIEQRPKNVFLAAELEEVLLRLEAANWNVLIPETMKSAGGATLTLQSDGSILASGKNVDADVYEVTFDNLPSSVARIRLEVLADPSLPENGPGRHLSGNFQLAEMTLHMTTTGKDSLETLVAISNATASYHWTGQEIEHVFDDDPDTVWHVWDHFGQNHSAIFQLKQPITAGPDDRLIVRLQHSAGEKGINLGRFRLAIREKADAVQTKNGDGSDGSNLRDSKSID